MFILKWLLILIVLLAVALVAAGQFGLLKGTPPTDLGVHEGRLKAPSTTPNSVSSQAGLHPGHPMRVNAEIAPLALRGDGPATLAQLKAVIEGMPGAVVVKTTPDYLYAQFTTRWMKYTDDVEFWFDPAAGVVQVRSASRIGRSDLGVNRQRVEAIRALLAAR
jgi:uncharacterized protein (DUF1499 family)